MASVALSGRRSLLGKFAAAAAGRGARTAPRIAAAARQHVVTVAALASVDFGVFRASEVAGFIVTGVCLLVLDFAVRG